jgi:hypothetical protein
MATTTEEFGSLGGIGLSVLLGATQIGVMAHGAKYSMGMELVTGASNTPAFMSASTPGHQLGQLILNPAADGLGGATKALPNDIRSVSEGVLKSETQAAKRALANTAFRTGIGSMILPVGFTSVLAAGAYSEGGGEELTSFLIQDVFANYYGNRVAENTGALTSRAKNIYSSNLSSEVSSLGSNATAQNYHTFLGSALARRLVNISGAYIGADVGFQAGKAIGEGLGNMLFDDANTGAFGMIGGIFGARGGAFLGANLARSPYSLAASALVIGGAKLLTEATADILKTGFVKGRGRGLDFAGDLSAYNTNSAVTMRQRALQSMHKSHLNARSALGQEASIVHMNRDYFANHRRL